MATTQYTTFWRFLENQKIEIPIIQRDYAQGRNGHEKLREKFLNDLKSALDKPEQKLKLDFVYGSLEDNKLQPLDGQQRLTTLWLLHWYIEYKAGKLSENVEKFKRFTYETRTSSREFCSKLSEFNIEQPTEKDKQVGIVEHIQNQTWFYSAWKQDPTIQAMLNMLGGTDVKEKDNDIIDGIEELFIDITKDQFVIYWEVLTCKKCPIVFYYLPLSELKLSDDLYIKMNARGKPLTNFENFKADLTGYLKKKKEENTKNNTWKMLDINIFEHKLDTDWTDIFWKNKSNDSKIDEIYFAFFNRYFLNVLILAKKPDGTYFLSQKEIEEHKAFIYLYGDESNDSSIKYSSFDIYTLLKNNSELLDKTIIEQFSCTLNNFTSINIPEHNNLFFSNWDKNTNFRFIPEYNDTNNSITTLTRQQRAIFHAVCCYFESNKYEEVSFKRWMRVVWNIVENANISSRQSMIGTIRLIDELKPHVNNIYNFLANPSTTIKSDIAEEQLAEERQKAKQIINNNAWESKIIEAEKTAFFNGAIRFLFTDRNKNYCWEKFDKRLEHSVKYFDSNGVKLEYQENARLICTLISLFTKWEQCWGNKKIRIGNGIETWSYIIKNENLLQPLVDLLDLDMILSEITNYSSCIEKFENGYEEIEKLAHEDMCNNKLINKAINTIGDGILLNFNWTYNKFALYKPNANANWKKYVIGNRRNKILFELVEEGIINTGQNIYGIPYFWGWDIEFKHDEKSYIFKSNDALYIWQSDNWKEITEVKQIDDLETYLKKKQAQ